MKFMPDKNSRDTVYQIRPSGFKLGPPLYSLKTIGGEEWVVMSQGRATSKDPEDDEWLSERKRFWTDHQFGESKSFLGVPLRDSPGTANYKTMFYQYFPKHYVLVVGWAGKTYSIEEVMNRTGLSREAIEAEVRAGKIGPIYEKRPGDFGRGEKVMAPTDRLTQKIYNRLIRETRYQSPRSDKPSIIGKDYKAPTIPLAKIEFQRYGKIEGQRSAERPRSSGPRAVHVPEVQFGITSPFPSRRTKTSIIPLMEEFLPTAPGPLERESEAELKARGAFDVGGKRRTKRVLSIDEEGNVETTEESFYDDKNED